VEDEMEAGSMI